MSGTKDFASPYSKPAPSHLEEDLPVGLSPSTNLQGPNWTSPDLDAPSLHPATSQTSPSTFAVDSRADGWPSNGFPFTALPHGETIFNAPASGVQTHNNLAGIDANALDWGDAGSSAVHQIDENANLYDRRGVDISNMYNTSLRDGIPPTIFGGMNNDKGTNENMAEKTELTELKQQLRQRLNGNKMVQNNNHVQLDTQSAKEARGMFAPRNGTYLEVRTYLPTSTNQYHPLYPYTNQGSFIHQSLGASQYQYNHQSEYGNEHQNPWINDPNVPRTGLTPGYHPGQDFTDPSGFPVTVYGHQAHYNVGQIPGPSMAPLKRKYGDDDDEDFVTAPRKREMPDWDVKAFETVGSKRGKKAQKLFADQEPINYENAEDDPGYTSPCPALTGFSKDNLPDEDADIISATTPAGARKNIKMDANGNPVCGPRGNPLRDLGSDMPDRVSSLHEDTWQLARIQRATGASSQDFFNRMILEKDTGYQTFCNRLERYLKADGKLSVRNWVPEKWENGKKIEGTPVSKQDVLALKCNDFDQMRYNCAWEINAAKTHMRRTDTSPWRPLRYPQGNFHETNDRMKRTSREVNIWRAAARAKGLAENKFEKLPAFVEAMKRTPSKKVAKKAAPAEANSEETTSEGPASEDDDLEAAVGAEAEESDFADSVPEIPGLEGGNMAAFETSGADSDDDFGSESEAEE